MNTSQHNALQGLENLGSTCSINSLIQIICRTDHLRNAILSSTPVSDTITAELREILDLMHIQGNSLSPKKFINNLYKHFGHIFQRGEQQDISEFWMFLFDKIATELGTPVDTIVIDTPEINRTFDTNQELSESQELQILCQASMNKFNSNKTSKWLETSQGILLHILSCNNCNNVIYNFEPFISIQLDIPENQDVPPTVAGMLRNYLKTQKCEGDWKCDKCKQDTTSYTRSIKLWKMPPVLIFIVKRFANFPHKNSSPINVNKNICVKKGSIISDINSEYTYNCTSLGYHFGSLFGGHYCSMCKSGEQHILYDDLNISIVNTEQAKRAYESSREAYMLVYVTDNN